MEERLLKVGEVAELLGMTINGVYNKVFKAQLPCIKISARALRFRRADIEKWLDSKSQGIAQTFSEAQKDIKKRPGRPRKGIPKGRVEVMVSKAKKEVIG